VLVELIRYQPFDVKAQPGKQRGFPRYAAYILHSQGQPVGIDLGEVSQIDTALENFRSYLSDRNSQTAQLKQSARTLDQLLMQPIRQQLGNKRHVLLSPDSTLNLIPFEALVDEGDRYLIETYDFTYLTSGRDLLRLQTRYPSKTPPVLLADPSFNLLEPLATGMSQPNQTRFVSPTDLFQQIYPPLRDAAEEVSAIAAQYGVTPLLGRQATEEAVKAINSPKLLVIATHGFFPDTPSQADNSGKANSSEPDRLADISEENPLLRTGLVLAGFQLKPRDREDGILTALEMTGLNLQGTKLVILSACGTGLGKLSSGEGVYGLRRALVLAGSESQLITLWKVDDTATKDLMIGYHKNLKAGKGRMDALRQAQLTMLKENSSYAHPYYWAGFIASGDWTPLP
jgi:CHAT domain-containing protein